MQVVVLEVDDFDFGAQGLAPSQQVLDDLLAGGVVRVGFAAEQNLEEIGRAHV